MARDVPLSDQRCPKCGREMYDVMGDDVCLACDLEADQDGTLRRRLAVSHRFEVTPDLEVGGYVIVFPDLPGCMSQCERLRDVPGVAAEIEALWLETDGGRHD